MKCLFILGGLDSCLKRKVSYSWLIYHVPLLANSVAPGDTRDSSGLLAGAGPERQGGGLSDPFLW